MKADIKQIFRSVGPSDDAAGPSLRCDCRNLTALLLPSHSALSLLGAANTEYDSPQIQNTLFFRTNQIEAKEGGRLNMQAGKKEHTKEDL